MRERITTFFLLGVLMGGSAAPLTRAAAPHAALLQPLSKSVLEDSSPAQLKQLRQFAEQYQDQEAGALAHMALGYHFFQEKKFAEAAGHLEMAREIPVSLNDYATFYLALANKELEKPDQVVLLLEGFADGYPASPLRQDAALQLAQAYIDLNNPETAILLLRDWSSDRRKDEAMFLLASAYAAAGRKQEAAEAFQEVYYWFPTSAKASEASRQLAPLRRGLAKSYPDPSVEMVRFRAENLYGRRRWRDARNAYRELANLAEGALLAESRVRVAACQYHLGATWPALTALEKLKIQDGESGAERLYIMAAGYRRVKRPDLMRTHIALLASRYPQSPWYEQALINAGNYYLLEKDYDQAGEFYRQSFEMFPESGGAWYGHWKLAWHAYRERRTPEARRLFEEHVQHFPASPQISSALYWLGRTVEDDSPVAAARYYRKIVDTFPNYYYGMLARQRLDRLPGTNGTIASIRIIPLSGIRRRDTSAEWEAGRSMAEKTTLERVELLESAWLMDWAIGEIKTLLTGASGQAWVGVELARLEQNRGRHHVALRYAKQYVPSYFTRNRTELSDDIWRLLFPVPYWDQIQKQARASQLDPYLVAGLIRQESEFNPRARSGSNARGLMQLLPSTARLVARKVPDRGARSYQLSKLYLPQYNLVYGTFYLKSVLDRFEGSLEQAVASYNAGPHRVQEWLQEGNFEDPAEFVESIPFTETRNYVQAVLRNAALYRQLYPGHNQPPLNP